LSRKGTSDKFNPMVAATFPALAKFPLFLSIMSLIFIKKVVTKFAEMFVRVIYE